MVLSGYQLLKVYKYTKENVPLSIKISNQNLHVFLMRISSKFNISHFILYENKTKRFSVLTQFCSSHIIEKYYQYIKTMTFERSKGKVPSFKRTVG